MAHSDHRRLRFSLMLFLLVGYASAQGEPAPDRFAGRFEGDGLVLQLQESQTAGFRGTLAINGTFHAVTGRREGEVLHGSYEAGGVRRSLEATFAGKELMVALGGKIHRLQPSPGKPGQADAAEQPQAPQALEGIYAGETTRYEHPRDWFSFDMPAGWSVYQMGDEGMILNPGLKPSDDLEAVVGLIWGRVPLEDQGQPVTRLIEKYVPMLRRALQEQGITIGDSDGPVRAYRAREVPGGVVTFAGRTRQAQAVRVWYGCIVKRDGWVGLSGIMLAGREAAYLPKVKRIFSSLDPRPPERNPALEAALVGRSFSASKYGRITKSAHHATYTFTAGNGVTRRVMTNIIGQPGLPGSSTDSERSGRYEVCGDILYLFFETGQEVAHIQQQGGQVIGFRFGTNEYR